MPLRPLGINNSVDNWYDQHRCCSGQPSPAKEARGGILKIGGIFGFSSKNLVLFVVVTAREGDVQDESSGGR